MLIDPDNGDYSLQPGSPAAGYGCITFPQGCNSYTLNNAEANLFSSKIRSGRSIEVEGEISENTIWAADTVTVIGDLEILNEVILDVSPGTQVNFAGFYKITVSGAIRAEGEAEDRISFRSSEPDSYQPDSTMIGSWNGIRFIGTDAANATSRFSYCIFENSKSLSENVTGGVISSYNFSELEITNCIFRNNLAIFGSAIGCDYNSAPLVLNNLFTENQAILAGSPFYLKYSHPQLFYNTIVANTIQNEDEWYVTGIIHTYIAKPQLTGNIIRENFTNYYFGDQVLEGKEYYINYNNIEGWSGGTGNIDLPAQFIQQGEQPYYLDQGSPCINAGINELPWELVLLETDIAGEPRIYEEIIDLGAYEWQGTIAEDEIVTQPELKITNYPNPFNPSTTISFNISSELHEQNEHFGLCIYNIKGQKIKTYKLNCHPEFSEGSVQNGNTTCPSPFDSSLPCATPEWSPTAWQAENTEICIYNVKGQKIKKYSIFNNQYSISSDQYSITWDGTDNSGNSVPSGIYFCKLKFGNKTASRKMILLK